MAKEKKKTQTTKEERLEDILMSCRNDLRGKASMTDKRDLLLTLVFLKFVTDRFEAQVEKIKAEYADRPNHLPIKLKNPASYRKDGVFYLNEDCRWDSLCAVEPNKRNVELDRVLSVLDRQEPQLKGAMPIGIFVRANLEPKVIKTVMDDVSKIDTKKYKEKDLIGRVYEYYLLSFSINADKEEGEFYTPESNVQLIAALLEPFDGSLYDPCCGSGGMFVQCMRVIAAHGGNTSRVTVFGQESQPDTYRLAKMNLAVRGISFDLGQKEADTFSNDQHQGKRFKYIMSNPPFNLKRWRGEKELLTDSRWKGYGVPPESNANYAWILHILSKLDQRDGMAGFLLANGALDDSDTLEIRRKLLENDKVEAIIVLPREMFYTTDISVTLWILNQNKKGGMKNGRKLRNREHEVLFVDLRTWNQNIYEKKFVKFTSEQIAAVQKIFFDWQGDTGKSKYAKPELYYSAKLKEIAEKGYSLVPSRYIEFVDRDTELDYKTALKEIGGKACELMKRQAENSANLSKAMKALGYGK